MVNHHKKEILKYYFEIALRTGYNFSMNTFNVKDFMMGFVQFSFVFSIIVFFIYGIYTWVKSIFFKNSTDFTIPSSSRRFKVDGDVIISLSDKEYIGKVVNISETGMFINIPKDLPVIGQEIDFKILLPNNGNKTVQGQGQVQWIRTSEDFGVEVKNKMDFEIPKYYYPKGFGLKFTSFNTQCTPVFTNLMNTLKNFQAS